ncbi:MAG: nucleotide sugar dehydrogenase [Candidatus Heimdallarchaeota archaeon]|nr:MAG: nucleotide sugar dehydrogenase [Candidatus Heimdallarchaeota archaeon]
MFSLEELSKKISDGSAKVGVIGLGYVGLPLAILMSKRFKVVGFEKSKEIIEQLKNGKSPFTDVTESLLTERLGNTLLLSDNEKDLGDCDFLIICVPTPLDYEKKPDLSYIKTACRSIQTFLKKGQFVILESTSYPGTTEEIMIPLFEKSGLKAGEDFGVAYSPERVDPGNKKFKVENIPKVVGGINETCTEIAAKLYESVLEAKVIRTRDCKTAEAAKIAENIFRDVNIALANELALIFERMGINAWEVIDIACTKPFGFMPFYPGAGVGGHCIPLDPLYLSYQAKKYEFIPRFIELSGEINDFMPIHTINLLIEGLKRVNKKITKSTITIFGIAYKRDVKDTRESPSRIIIEQIISSGGNAKIFDPFAKEIETKYGKYKSEKDAEQAVKNSDAIVIVVDHTIFTEEFLSNLIKTMDEPVIVDCKNVLKEGLKGICEDGIYLGIGKPNHSE